MARTNVRGVIQAPLIIKQPGAFSAPSPPHQLVSNGAQQTTLSTIESSDTLPSMSVPMSVLIQPERNGVGRVEEPRADKGKPILNNKGKVI